jgi:hypothetical protein
MTPIPAVVDLPRVWMARFGARFRTAALAFAGWLAVGTVPAADPVFSGPQAGEATTSFQVLEFAAQPGDSDRDSDRERDPIAENAGAPTAIVFIHAIERSLVPLLRTVDEYGALRKDRLKTEFVFLAADRLAGAERVKAASRSLRLRGRVGLSPEGVEGPGNYGLNKDCLMTILAAKGNRVTANFALIQPGIADAPRVIEALARVCGDTNPPSLESLVPASAAGMARRGGSRDGAAPDRTTPAAAPADGEPKREGFPGAVPTDPTLNRLLRQVIRPTNDVATVDGLLKDMETHIAGKPELQREAIDGWTRVLHFGDHYGTEYARRQGRAFLRRLAPGGSIPAPAPPTATPPPPAAPAPATATAPSGPAVPAPRTERP